MSQLVDQFSEEERVSQEVRLWPIGVLILAIVLGPALVAWGFEFICR